MQVQRFSFRDLAEDGVLGRIGASPFHSARKAKQEEELPPPPPPPPPTFSEDEMKAAERDGYQKGFIAGIADGRGQAESEQAEVDRQLVKTAEGFVNTIAPIFADYRRMMMEMREQMPKVALCIARKVASNALEANAQTVVEEMALRCCETMIAEPKLTITVHEKLRDTVERKLKDMVQRQSAAAHIVVVGDAAMPQEDCKIEWHNGAMQRNTAQFWQQIDKVVDSMVATATRDTTQQLNTLQAHIPEANATPTKE